MNTEPMMLEPGLTLTTRPVTSLSETVNGALSLYNSLSWVGDANAEYRPGVTPSSRNSPLALEVELVTAVELR
jgi:hypothetical protein